MNWQAVNDALMWMWFGFCIANMVQLRTGWLNKPSAGDSHG